MAGSYQLPNGSSLQIHKTLAAALPFTTITAAKEAVLTVSGNTDIKAGDVVFINSSTNAKLADRPAYVKTATATAITLLNFDTTDTAEFISGVVGTTGSIQKVQDWVDLPLASGIANSGGDRNTVNVQFIQDDDAQTLFTTNNPEVTTLTTAHDAWNASRPLLEAHSKRQDKVVYRVFNPKAADGVGEYRLFVVQMSFNGNPVMTVNEVETNTLAMTIKKGAYFYKKDTIDALLAS